MAERPNDANVLEKAEGSGGRSPSPEPQIFHEVGSDSSSLRRDLRERHIVMIAFSTTIGVGVFLGSGLVIAQAGPGGAVLSFVLVGTIVASVLVCLGEMVSLIPVEGPIVEFASRFLDSSVGFAIGWIYWIMYVIFVAAEIVQAAQLMQTNFHGNIPWDWSGSASLAVWISVFIVVVFLVNLFPVRIYGEIEYVFGTIKLLFIIALILAMVVLGSRNGGKYWSAPYGFFSKSYTWTDAAGVVHVLGGDKGRLCSVWSAMSIVVYQYLGMEAVAITAAEARDPPNSTRSEVMRISFRKIILRIIILYSVATFVVSFAAPYSDPRLHSPVGKGTGESSPYVLAFDLARVHFMPQFLNGMFVWSATSSAINCAYVASRTLHALARSGRVWPPALQKRLKKTRGGSVPQAALLFSCIPALLAYLAAGTNRSKKPRLVFDRLQNAGSAGGLIVYIVICLSYVNFYRRLKLKRAGQDRDAWRFNRDDNRYPFRPNGQPFRSIYGLLGSSLLLLFNGWASMLRPHSSLWIADFVSSYIMIIIFLCLVIGHKFANRWRTASVALWDGVERVDEDPRVAEKRRGKLNLDNYNFSWENTVKIATWVGQWTK